MATPRTGNYAPLNPLGMHNENRYRNSDYSMGAETQVFEGFLGTGLKGGGKLLGKGGKGIGKLSLKGIKGSGKLFSKGFKKVSTLRKLKAQKLADDIAVEGATKATANTFSKITIKGVGNGAVIVGGLIISGMILFGANDLIDGFVDNFTGANCGKNVAERGLAEGTPEYEQAVKECQQSSFNKLAGLSVGVVGVVGLVGLLVIKKYLPKGSKEEEEEE